MLEPIAQRKASLRRTCRATRQALAPQDCQVPGLWERVRQLETQLGLTRPTVLGFVGVGREIETLPELERRREQGEALYIPRCEGEQIRDGIMEFYAYPGRDALVAGPYGLLEPRPTQPWIADASNGKDPVIWVPGLAFDTRGGRLGQGGGFYDRYLARPTVRGAIRIGLCLDVALCSADAPEIPMGPSDMRVDWVVTPTRTIQVRLARG